MNCGVARNTVPKGTVLRLVFRRSRASRHWTKSQHILCFSRASVLMTAFLGISNPKCIALHQMTNHDSHGRSPFLGFCCGSTSARGLSRALFLFDTPSLSVTAGALTSYPPGSHRGAISSVGTPPPSSFFPHIARTHVLNQLFALCAYRVARGFGCLEKTCVFRPMR